MATSEPCFSGARLGMLRTFFVSLGKMRGSQNYNERVWENEKNCVRNIGTLPAGNGSATVRKRR